MGQQPLVSVIIPTYNREAVLRKAIESVQAQSFRDWELIVVDDGSTDNSRTMVEGFNDSRIQYIYQANQGVSVARNLGVGQSSGYWLAFLDSDDRWLPKKLEKQLELLEKEKTAWAHTDEIWIRNKVRVNPHKKHAKPEGRIYLKCLPLCVVSPSSVMIQRAVFDEVGAFDPLLPAAEDYDLWLRLAARYPISLQREFLIEKTGGHADQLSGTFLGLDRFRVRALRKQLNSPFLSSLEIEKTRKIFSKKCKILASGYLKHGKKIVAEYYNKLCL